MSIAFKESQNNANDESFANMLNIQILQHNCARLHMWLKDWQQQSIKAYDISN